MNITLTNDQFSKNTKIILLNDTPVGSTTKEPSGKYSVIIWDQSMPFDTMKQICDVVKKLETT